MVVPESAPPGAQVQLSVRRGREAVALMRRAMAAGAKEIYPVEEAHGWLLGRVVEPFGHHWEIGKPISTWPPQTTSDGSPR